MRDTSKVLWTNRFAGGRLRWQLIWKASVVLAFGFSVYTYVVKNYVFEGARVS